MCMDGPTHKNLVLNTTYRIYTNASLNVRACLSLHCLPMQYISKHKYSCDSGAKETYVFLKTEILNKKRYYTILYHSIEKKDSNGRVFVFDI